MLALVFDRFCVYRRGMSEIGEGWLIKRFVNCTEVALTRKEIGTLEPFSKHPKSLRTHTTLL
jgi:hypothetical protein